PFLLFRPRPVRRQAGHGRYLCTLPFALVRGGDGLSISPQRRADPDQKLLTFWSFFPRATPPGTTEPFRFFPPNTTESSKNTTKKQPPTVHPSSGRIVGQCEEMPMNEMERTRRLEIEVARLNERVREAEDAMAELFGVVVRARLEYLNHFAQFQLVDAA